MTDCRCLPSRRHTAASTTTTTTTTLFILLGMLPAFINSFNSKMLTVGGARQACYFSEKAHNQHQQHHDLFDQPHLALRLLSRQLTVRSASLTTITEDTIMDESMRGKDEIPNDGDDHNDKDNTHNNMMVAPPRLNNKTGNNKTRNNRKTEKSPQTSKKGKNPVVGDTSFLRKRTANLLKITAQGYNNGPGGAAADSLSSRGMKVDRKTFNWLINAWAFSGELDAPDKASALLRRMEELFDRSTTPHLFRPDVRTYTKVISAISRSGRPDAGDMANRVLQKMETLHLSGKNKSARPNTYTYTAVIESYANCGADGSAAKAEEICQVMVQQWKTADSDVQPTSRSFNAAINAWAKSGTPEAGQRAENLFKLMLEAYQAGNKEAKPNAFNYNAVIAAWANCPEEGSAKRAEQILSSMESRYRAGNQDVKPTTVSFNAVIDAWAKSGEDDGAERAEELLRHMEDLYESGENIDAKPNVRSFNSVVNAWAKSGREDAAVKAEGVLDLMEKLFEDGNDDVRPDAHSFCTVIAAWARSQKAGKADRALNLFRQMKKLYKAGNQSLRPNVVAYNALMNACAFTNGDIQECNRAVEIAHSVLKELEQSATMNPDQVTYGSFLKVLANQMPDCDSRTKAAEVIFKKCSKAGQVGNFVLQQLSVMVSAEMFTQITGQSPEAMDTASLPQEWRCNVVEGKWARRRRFEEDSNRV